MMKNFIGSRAMPDLVYHSPKDVNELMSLLSDSGEPVKIVAGCTDFVPAVRTGRWTFDDGITIIDIKKVKDFDTIKKEGNLLKIGACARLTQILESEDVRKYAPVLAQAAEQMASLQVRNTATIGGNICMASPAGDTVPPLLVMDAGVTIKDKDGEQDVMLKDFFTGPGQSILKPGQVLTSISIPITDQPDPACFLKIGTRTAVIISIVSAAVRVGSTNGICENTRIALGSVAPTPIRVYKAESFLDKKSLDDKTIEECARIASEDISPISDLRGGKEYRKDVAGTLVKRAIKACRG